LISKKLILPIRGKKTINKIQRSFSTNGFPERRISTAAIISKIRIILKISQIHI